MTPVGIGVIGAGNISDTYLENLTAFGDVDVRFVADLVPERAAAQAEKYQVGGSGTVTELLARDDITIVVNLTVPAAHVPISSAALDAGKHVWQEKPLALDRAGGRALLDNARARGLRIACAPDTILGAGLQTARRAIADGRIGTPLNAVTIFQYAGPDAWHPAPEFLFTDGAGPLFDIGPYYLTTLVHLLGPVRRVTGAGGRARDTRTIGSGPRAGTRFPVTVPTTVTALIEFTGGGSAQLVLSFDSALARSGFFEVTGTEGTLVVPDPNRFDGDNVLHLLDADAPVTLPATGHDGTRGTGAVELARAIAAGRPERAGGDIAYHVLDVMLSIAESIEGGNAVDVASSATIPPPLDTDWDPRQSTV